MSAREELLALARRHMWAAWQLSSEELASQAAETLLGLGMLVPEGGAQELKKLRARVAELEQREAIVAGFVAKRAEYITNLRNCSPGNGHDHDRWQGHAAARRQLSELLGLPVAWPEEAAEKAAERSAEKLTRFLAPTQVLREDVYESPLHRDYRTPHDLPETGGAPC